MMMMMRRRWEGWLWLNFVVVVMVGVNVVHHVKCEAQTRLLNKGCSQFSVTDLQTFSSNLNLSFSDLQAQLASSKRFATTVRIPIYAMVQCRNYMSTPDCLACYRVAQAQIRNCSAPTGPANGARVIYEGCFLRSIHLFFYLPKKTFICLSSLLIIYSFFVFLNSIHLFLFK